MTHSPIKRSVIRQPSTLVRGKPCAYCGAPAVNGEHVVPQSMVRNYNRFAPEGAPSIPREWLAVVPSCITCNVRKGARRLVPPTWKKYIDALNDFFGGVPWRVWTGDPKDEAFRGVHK